MTSTSILNEAGAAGITLWLEGETLRYRGTRGALTADLLHRLKAHKPAILAALARTNADALWLARGHHRDRRPYRRGRYAPGWTLADWQAYAEPSHGLGCTVTPLAGLPSLGTGQPR